ncbi:NADP-dependent oxidoreductase [Oceanibacterium hippocampi]|uniref:Putative NADP-dependent oxidoreductase YfmJ n=1 Tax=Oceanibacterium hippocampi TaxID=745714 RepID=A0A1Y5U048_9PROT|nr:NADP-dependent oxidoreductase [Oceanibacterium hippocampi]SLN72801.1 Putative NADP-dependent oxidoreductase YfmJ [Oceanibacterium hippocampi]
MTAHANRQLKLAARPFGLPKDSDFEIVAGEVGEPGEGEVLVRVIYLSLDPAMRGWMNEGKSYVRPVRIGEVMRALGLGQVVASGDARFAVGDYVVGLTGVQEMALLQAKDLTPAIPKAAPLPSFLGGLGMPGLTAYFGLLDICAPKPGETVVISGAAGAVGGVVGQIAKLKGCRAVGIAGGAEKCAYVRDELGFDACIDYKAGDLNAGLKEHCPDGIDCYFDNVGGETLDTVLRRINVFARIAFCGAISIYNATEPPAGPKNYLSLLANRAKVQGFIVFDFQDRYPQAIQDLAGWYAEGKLKFREHVVEGRLDDFRDTLVMLFEGRNFGKLVLQIGQP